MLKPSLEKAKRRNNEELLELASSYILDEQLEKLGLGKAYFIKTYGCQMNEHDTENIKAMLEDMHFIETDQMEQADLILLNTCAIRENAHNKVFGYLGRIKHLKETKPHIMTGLCGCMAQEESVVDALLAKYKWMNFVFGTHNMHHLPQILSRAMEKQELEIEVFSGSDQIVEDIPSKRNSKYKAWVNIMYGCDKFCTYCIVPYTRGKQRSRDPEQIKKEVSELVDLGYQEITLLGQNVNAYGKDLNLDYTMANLLEEIAKLKINRIRFVTSHPWDFSDDMIKVIKTYPNIMPYIHLPVQSGSNRILRLMGRRYTKEVYLELFQKLKTALPYSSITTDIIVGFPGETQQDFEETLDLVKTCKFDSAFTFIFSKRVGTPAEKMDDDVSIEVKNKRLAQLNELVNECANLANQAYVGKTVPVLLESISEKNSSMLMGYTDTMKLVNVKASKELIGKIVDVEIKEAKTWSLDGIIK